MATPTEIRLWPVVVGSVVAVVAAVAFLVGAPIAAVRSDDPSRLLLLLMVPVLVAFGVLGLAREPVGVIVSHAGIELVWLRRTRKIDAGEVARFVTPKRRYLLGEDILVMLNDGTKVELPDIDGRVLMAIRHHLPDIPITRSDSGYLST